MAGMGCDLSLSKYSKLFSLNPLEAHSVSLLKALNIIMENQPPLKISIICQNDKGGKLGLSQAPGKNLKQGRNGVTYSRSIFADIANFKSRGMSMMVCLLSDSELRSLGVNPRSYHIACNQNSVKLVQYPIVEMSIPNSLQEFEFQVVQKILEEMQEGGTVVVHCRGGIGRSGLVAACTLLHFGVATAQKAIQWVRTKRSRNSVESSRQEDFVKSYFKQFRD